MSKSEFELAVTQLAAERGLPREKVVAAVEAALASAYRKESQAAGQNITVRLDAQTGAIRLFVTKTVVNAMADPRKEIVLKEARRASPDCKAGDEVEVEITNPSSVRIAALTAKQVVLQRLREAERDLIYADFLDREGELVPGRVERTEPGRLVISLGRAEAYLPREEQVSTERYRSGQTMQFYMLEVRRTPKGPELILSRTHRNLLRRLLEREVPEIYHGAVEIKAIAREGGIRSKVAVAARQEGVDPVGSCIGPRGVRIQNVVNELQGEKIDVFQWHKDLRIFIANALGPAQVSHVDLNEDDKVAAVVVPDNQLSLAIGRDGQMARLTAKLTGWRIDIKGITEYEALKQAAQPPAPEAAQLEVAEAVLEAPVAPEPAVATTPIEAPASAAPPEAPPPPQLETVAKGETAEAEPAPEVAAEAPGAKEEAAAPSEPGADVWALDRVLAQRATPSVVRFAEEIMPGRSKAREGSEGAQEEAARAKPRRARRTRPVGDEEEPADG